MNEKTFREWLSHQGYDKGTVESRVGNCQRVERYEGDLDEAFRNDKCASLIERLTYSTSDMRNNVPPLHCIPMSGNIRNGTATLKQAVKLYIRFCEDGDFDSYFQRGIQAYHHEGTEVKTQIPDRVQALDSYAIFLKHFNLEKQDFYSFGLDNTIFASLKDAKYQWEMLKSDLLENRTLTIRSYGRNGKNTDIFFELYRFLFGNDQICEDPTNNTVPRRNIQRVTGYKINTSLVNYQCSHVFGHTKNPLLFESVWNICFTPKMFDPLTGHEAKGPWPDEYQQLFQKTVYKRFQGIIEDYNAFVVEYGIHNQIRAFVKSVDSKYEETFLRKFQEDALEEWKKIIVNDVLDQNP